MEMFSKIQKHNINVTYELHNKPRKLEEEEREREKQKLQYAYLEYSQFQIRCNLEDSTP